MKKIPHKLKCCICDDIIGLKCIKVGCPHACNTCDKPKLKRMPVPIDEAVVIKLQGLIQSRTQKRMSVAAIVRLALEQMLETEAELSE